MIFTTQRDGQDWQVTAIDDDGQEELIANFTGRRAQGRAEHYASMLNDNEEMLND